MLNCILGMVEKTKRALAILQHRSLEQVASSIWSPPGRGRHFAAGAHESAVEYLKKARAEHIAPGLHYAPPKPPVLPPDIDRLAAAAVVPDALRRRPPPPPPHPPIGN